MSEDGGDTWSPVMGYDKLGLFEYSIKWPTWTEHMARSVADDEYLNVNGIATIRSTSALPSRARQTSTWQMWEAMTSSR